jgi:hypothetical protein
MGEGFEVGCLAGPETGPLRVNRDNRHEGFGKIN